MHAHTTTKEPVSQSPADAKALFDMGVFESCCETDGDHVHKVITGHSGRFLFCFVFESASQLGIKWANERIASYMRNTSTTLL